MSTPHPSWTDAGFMLANWEVRPRHGTLARRDQGPSEPVRIEPRVMAVLTCLARHVGEVVTRDEFSAEVWGGRVVSDEALSRCISLLRQVLADDSREPRFIRTIARVGYTLVPTPVPLMSGGVDVAAESSPQASPTLPVATEAVAVATLPQPRIDWSAWLRNGRPRRHTILAVGCIGLIVVVALVYSAREMRSGADAPPPLVTRLLVMPFDTSEAKSVGGDVGVALADEIADSLSHVGRLQISGRTSADTLAAAHTDAVEAGRTLGVDAVLNGEVAERPGGLRVTVRLTATKDARVLWSRVYERQAADIFAVQSSIAAAVVRQLIGPLSREGLWGVPTVEPDSRDLEAYQLYLRGAHQVRLRGEDSLRRAVDLFSAAVRRDPSYARAQVGLASAYALLPSYSFEDPTEMYALAEKALANADRLSHNRSESAGTRGYLGFMRGQWIDSETAFRTAIVADPNNPEVRQMYSQLLGAVGHIDAALAQTRLAQEIDPLAPVVADRLGILHLWLGRDADAERDAALARELGLDEVAYPETKILLKLHEHDDANATDDLRALLAALHRSNSWVGPAFDAYRHPEKRPAIIALLDRTRAAGDISARIYFGTMVLLESPVRALRGFAALPDRGGNDLEFLFSIDAAAVRRDPAFGEFIRTMGIEAYWDRFGWPRACRREGSQIACH
jgi:DNA-binding winged helix-turn-helix (wHTH) protein/TolB-like protein/Tfp pilus assembly protein PilF